MKYNALIYIPVFLIAITIALLNTLNVYLYFDLLFGVDVSTPFSSATVPVNSSKTDKACEY